jgi:hypothetical protein
LNQKHSLVVNEVDLFKARGQHKMLQWVQTQLLCCSTPICNDKYLQGRQDSAMKNNPLLVHISLSARLGRLRAGMRQRGQRCKASEPINLTWEGRQSSPEEKALLIRGRKHRLINTIE